MNPVKPLSIDSYESSKAGGFKISLAAKVALGILTAAAVAGAAVSAVLFFHMAIPIAMTALIASAIALFVLSLTIVYQAIEKYMPGPIQALVNGPTSLLKELIFIPLVMALMAGQAIFGKREKSTVNEGDHVVLMVHGYIGTSAHFLYLRYRLEQEKVGPVYTIDLGNPFLSIDDYAKKVAEKVEALKTDHPNKKITLVGHSMGGIVVSNYVGQCNDASHIEKVITLGSPLQGTHLAKIAIGQCAREMERESAYLKEVEQGVANSKIPFVNVGSTTDLIILPNSSTSFKEKEAKEVLAPGMGHASYLFSDAIADLLAKEVKG